MSRVKRGVAHHRRVKNVLKSTRGYLWGRKSKIKLAKVARLKAGVHAFADRRKKKGEFRKLWTLNINAAVREEGLTYSKFINLLKKKKISINRKVMMNLAENFPAVFAKIVEAVKTQNG